MPGGFMQLAEPKRIHGDDRTLELLRDNECYIDGRANNPPFSHERNNAAYRCWEQGRVDAMNKRGHTLAEVGGLTKLDARKVA